MLDKDNENNVNTETEGLNNTVRKKPLMLTRRSNSADVDSKNSCMRNFLLDLFLAVIAVVPAMLYICKTIKFTYEINDDAAVVQILNGAYTGTPDAHSTFVKYPLSWIIKMLYVKNPPDILKLWPTENVNWYVVTLSMLAIIGMVCALFSILRAFERNRLVLCVLFMVPVLLFWTSCFVRLTFSTAGSFMACMGLIYFAFEDKKRAAMPLNLIVLCFLLGSAWCLRDECLYMILPFIFVIFLMKCDKPYLKSWRPYVIIVIIAAMTGGLLYLDRDKYGSDDWQYYLRYNHVRSIIQDYTGFPDYNENKDIYTELDIDEEELYSISKYRYCLLDDYSPATILNLYDYMQQDSVGDLSLIEKAMIYKGSVIPRMAKRSKAIPDGVAKSIKIMALTIVVLMILNILFFWKKGFKEHAITVIGIELLGLLVYGEWLYLIINGRFPARVEETIWLVTFTVMAVICGMLLQKFTEKKWFRLPVIADLILAIVIAGLLFGQVTDNISTIRTRQDKATSGVSDKAEVFTWMEEHSDNIYVRDIYSFSGASTPYDVKPPVKSFVSGSWMAYSPLYYKKLDLVDTDTLGSKFLLRKNVYLITEDSKPVEKVLGKKEGEIQYTVVDRIETSKGSVFKVVKIDKYGRKESISEFVAADGTLIHS